MPSTPPKTRLYAIGDIHGRLDLLTRLMERIAEDAARRADVTAEVIFLGDYIDRGSDSRGVIDFCLNRIPSHLKAVFLRGNHERAMLRFLDGEVAVGADWLTYGGDAAVMSYGINPYRQNIAVLREAFVQAMPETHRRFLESTVLFCERGDYYFVHAGIRPEISLGAQSEKDQLLIREPFLSSTADHGKIIVHGHTIADEPEERSNRIGIDTGAFATGRLTCLVLEGEDRAFWGT